MANDFTKDAPPWNVTATKRETGWHVTMSWLRPDGPSGWANVEFDLDLDHATPAAALWTAIAAEAIRGGRDLPDPPPPEFGEPRAAGDNGMQWGGSLPP